MVYASLSKFIFFCHVSRLNYLLSFPLTHDVMLFVQTSENIPFCPNKNISTGGGLRRSQRRPRAAGAHGAAAAEAEGLSARAAAGAEPQAQ